MYDGFVRTIQGVCYVNYLKNLYSIGQLDYLGCKIRTKGDERESCSGENIKCWKM